MAAKKITKSIDGPNEEAANGKADRGRRVHMARIKYKTLTEQMFYILLCLRTECCGIDIMEMVSEMTGGRVLLGPGTLYALLGDFVKQGFIKETAVEGRKRSYVITDAGEELLREEYKRLKAQVTDYERAQ